MPAFEVNGTAIVGHGHPDYEVHDDVDVDPEDDGPDELPPLPGHMNREGSRLRNKIKEAFFSY